MIEAAAAVLAAMVSFGVVYVLSGWFGAGTQPAITAAILAIGLSRRAPRAHGATVLLLPVILRAKPTANAPATATAICSAGVSEHPAGWIDAARSVYEDARSHHQRIRADDRLRGDVRRAIGRSRRALANHGKGKGEDAAAVPVGEALRSLRSALIAAPRHRSESVAK